MIKTGSWCRLSCYAFLDGDLSPRKRETRDVESYRGNCTVCGTMPPSHCLLLPSSKQPPTQRCRIYASPPPLSWFLLINLFQVEHPVSETGLVRFGLPEIRLIAANLTFWNWLAKQQTLSHFSFNFIERKCLSI